MSVVETEFAIYRWEDETMTFVRRAFVKHPEGQPPHEVALQRVLEHTMPHLTQGKYRAIPVDVWHDFTVESRVVFV